MSLKVLVGGSGSLPIPEALQGSVRIMEAGTALEHAVKCAHGWCADAYLHVGLNAAPLPADLLDVPVLRFATVPQWHASGRALWAGAQLMDRLLGDRELGALIEANGWPCGFGLVRSGASAQACETALLQPRDIDILFLGSLNEVVASDRNRWLARLAEYSDRYRVVIAEPESADEAIALARRARILFTRSAYGGIEEWLWGGAASGALIFAEEENSEVAGRLVNGRQYVAYREETLPGLLAEILGNEVARSAIAAAGAECVRQRHRQDLAWAELLGNLCASDGAGSTRSDPESLMAISLQRSTCRFPGTYLKTRGLLEDARGAGMDYGRVMEAISSVATADALLQRGPGSVRLATEAVRAGREAVKANDANPYAQAAYGYALLGRVQLTQNGPPSGRNDIIEAAVALATASQVCSVESSPVETPVGYVERDGFGCPTLSPLFDALMDLAFLGRSDRGDTWTARARRAITWICETRLSELAAANLQAQEAFERAAAAAAALPEQGESWSRLARSEAVLGRLEEAVEHYQVSFALSPLQPAAWMEWIELLRALGEDDAALQFGRSCARMASAVRNIGSGWELLGQLAAPPDVKDEEG